MQVTCNSSDILYNLQYFPFSPSTMFTCPPYNQVQQQITIWKTVWSVQNKSRKWFHLTSSQYASRHFKHCYVYFPVASFTFAAVFHNTALSLLCGPPGDCDWRFLCWSQWRRIQMCSRYLEEYGWPQPGIRKPPACTSLVSPIDGDINVIVLTLDSIQFKCSHKAFSLSHNSQGRKLRVEFNWCKMVFRWQKHRSFDKLTSFNVFQIGQW